LGLLVLLTLGRGHRRGGKLLPERLILLLEPCDLPVVSGILSLLLLVLALQPQQLPQEPLGILQATLLQVQGLLVVMHLVPLGNPPHFGQDRRRHAADLVFDLFLTHPFIIPRACSLRHQSCPCRSAAPSLCVPCDSDSRHLDMSQPSPSVPLAHPAVP